MDFIKDLESHVQQRISIIKSSDQQPAISLNEIQHLRRNGKGKALPTPYASRNKEVMKQTKSHDATPGALSSIIENNSRAGNTLSGRKRIELN